MKNKFLLVVSILFFISSCSGMSGKRSENSDEFLIEKKNPLVMPPDIDDLPKPKESVNIEENDNNFKETIKSKNLKNKKSNKKEPSNSLQESIIEKIK